MPTPLTVLEQARAGDAGPAAELVARTAKAIARTGEFTTLSGSRFWTANDVNELLGDFFSKKGRLDQLVLGATSEKHLRGRIETSLKRLILDRLRTGPSGVLRRQIQRRARARLDIVAVKPLHWSLSAHQHNSHWGGPIEELQAAAARVPVDPPPAWPEESERQAPSTTHLTVDALLLAVLEAAGAPVEQSLTTTVVATRILPVDPTRVVDQGAAGPVDILARSPEDLVVEAEAEREAAMIVNSIWAAMDDDERILLPHLFDSARAVADAGVIARGKTVINQKQNRLLERLSKLITQVPEPQRVVNQLYERHAVWEAGHHPGGEP